MKNVFECANHQGRSFFEQEEEAEAKTKLTRRPICTKGVHISPNLKEIGILDKDLDNL